ncbi:lantibiotic dehydratase [Frankia sp. R43]|uniref:lantibiotic dehydratase n=1 Tax=Frankia sp. R43 TaxID=269536 RepID=UPI0006CA259E|nr:lantibiotic dehydratase [Frankia sp. R43]KPM50575.1 lantibiotic dehydratase [Frankia sp. R43]
MYQHLDFLVVRAAVNPAVDAVERWPDLVGPAALPESWRLWLRQVMQNRAFETALEQASPVLARRVREIRDGRQVPEAGVRRAVLSVMRYLLRASGRATPFGLFAGVAPACVADHASVRAGAAHRAVARVEAGWLCAVVDRLEADPAVRARLDVVANNLVFERDGHLVLEHRAGEGTDGAPTRVQVRAHAPVRAAMGISCRSVRLSDLAARLASEFAPVPADVVDRLLADLVAQRFLLTNLRPPMTATDPLHQVVDVLQATLDGAPVTAEAARVAERLNRIVDGLRNHDSASSWAVARSSRERLGQDMAEVHPSAEPALRVDLRMDWALAVPRSVAAEAAAAAGVLVRLARRSTLSSGWDAWHGRFLERYGPCALVPVLDAVDPEIGLGYPAGYAGSPAPPVGVTFTDRDAKLFALAQNAALRREREIVLDDRMISDLTVVDQDARVQPTTELTLRVHAARTRSLDEGAFTLAVVGVSRRAGTTTGRFLDLFDAQDGARMRALYAGLPTASRDALSVQISAPARYTNTDTVGRAPQVMAHRLSLGEYDDSEGGGSLSLDDIVVTADVHRIYLLSLSRRQLVEPVALNAVEPVRRAHPLARFLAEAPAALSVPCAPFDWGVAARLPFLPALRHGRTVLSPARWLLGAADLPGSAAGWTEWDRALASWREQVNLPSAVYLGDGDQRIGLDLSEPAHRVLLRSHLERSGAALLRAAPGTDAAGWVGGHAHEIVVPLAAVAAPAASPGWLSRAQVVGRDHGHLPGCDARFSVKLYAGLGCQDDILTRHLPHLVDELNEQATGEARWWFLRYHDPDDHLRLRLAVTADGVAPTADRIGAWTQRLRRAGLISRAQWDTYFPETSRFGGTAAMDAAEAYFAADSAAALAQLAASREKSGPDRRALTAASVVDIVTGLIGDTAEATRWLISHTRTESSAPARTLYQQAVALANPADPRALAAQPGGERVLSCWAHRREALAAYRHVLQETRAEAPSALLPDLLHLHHVRMAGVSLAGERACLHLARAAALSWTARTRNPS